MGAITSLFVRKVVTAAGRSVDGDALLRSVGVDPDDKTDVKKMVSDAHYYALLETIMAQLDDASGFPVRVGQSMCCDDYGAFGLAWKTAPTLRGSFERAERYARLMSSVVEYEVRNHDKGAYFMLHREGERRLGLRLSNEMTLASVASISRQVTPGSFAPLEVHCKHPAPATVSAHEQYFGCPIIFGSDMDALLVSSEALACPNRLGDPAVSRFLEAHLDAEIATGTQTTSFEQVLVRRISERLSDGPPRAAEIAKEMGVSERTLHRRLSEGGVSFQGLLNQTRRRLAEGLLVQSDHSIAEIAFLTGFSEQSSFSRAFRGWLDQTPASFREINKHI
ncbi:MAG: AraC family transcriptional regulator [Marinosulfonomonas sp.]|nr:AraC family transcriptional regulator [Marinosulfonomonas sp.]